MTARPLTLRAQPARAAKLLGASLCIVALAACASVSDQEKAIGAFSEATVNSAKAVVAYDEAAAAIATTEAKAKILASPATLMTLDEAKIECNPLSTQCGAFYVSPEDDSSTPVPVTTIIPNTVGIARAIEGYATALGEIAKADATAEVNTALGKASGAISSLASFVNPQAAPGLKAISGPAVNGLSWLYGKYQENLKLEALREATKGMNPHIKEAATLFSEQAEAVTTASTTILVQKMIAAKDAFRAKPTDANLMAVSNAASALDKAIKAPVSAVFVSLSETHDKLTTALVEGPESWEEIFEAIKRLGSDAETLFGIAKDLKAAVAAQSTASTQ